MISLEYSDQLWCLIRTLLPFLSRCYTLRSKISTLAAVLFRTVCVRAVLSPQRSHRRKRQMCKAAPSILIACLVFFCACASAMTYTSNFANTENPISEVGKTARRTALTGPTVVQSQDWFLAPKPAQARIHMTILPVFSPAHGDRYRPYRPPYSHRTRAVPAFKRWSFAFIVP